MQNTDNFNMNLLETNDYFSIQKQNENFEIIDDELFQTNQKLEDLKAQTQSNNSALSSKIDQITSTINNKIDTSVSTINNKIDTSVSTINNKINTVKNDLTSLNNSLDGKLENLDKLRKLYALEWKQNNISTGDILNPINGIRNTSSMYEVFSITGRGHLTNMEFLVDNGSTIVYGGTNGFRGASFRIVADGVEKLHVAIFKYVTNISSSSINVSSEIKLSMFDKTSIVRTDYYNNPWTFLLPGTIKQMNIYYQTPLLFLKSGFQESTENQANASSNHRYTATRSIAMYEPIPFQQKISVYAQVLSSDTSSSSRKGRVICDYMYALQ